MADIRFEEEYIAPGSAKRQNNSRITQFFIDRSFGLIRTPFQAMIVQLVLSGVLFICAGYFFSKSSDLTIPAKPSQELINVPQPTRPIN
jgi:hypothetical protein